MSEEDPSDLFDTDNVVVCQYDKVLYAFSYLKQFSQFSSLKYYVKMCDDDQ